MIRTQTTMPSIYRSLDQERHEIRLLRLHSSGSYDSQIRCSLDYAFLDNVPGYEALSYVWGPLEFSQEILVEGQPHNVTENLECALRHLRQTSKDRILWVDALCINQDDIAERSHQVMLMKDVYSSCACDLAWLGPNPGNARQSARERAERAKVRERRERADRRGGSEYDSDAEEEGKEEEEEEDDDDKRVFEDENLPLIHEGMRYFCNILNHDAETLESMRMMSSKEDRRRARDGEPATSWLLKYDAEWSLRTLFSHAPLWGRMWVMQELACARRVLLVAGTETLDWDDVASFLAEDNRPYADAFHVAGGHSSLFGAVVTIFGRVRTIQQQRRIVRDVEEGRYESKLIDVLARFKFADSRDPRDLVYGLLGLVSEPHPIRVNYAQPAKDLFVDITKFFVDSSGNLDIICQTPWTADTKDYNDQTSSLAGLPSWAVDFTHSARFAFFEGGLESLLFAQRGIFSAGSPTCEVPCSVSSGGTLHVRGVILDRLGPIYDPETEPAEPTTEDWLQDRVRQYFQHEFLNEEGTAVYIPTGESLTRAFWRTLVMDCKSYPIKRLSEEEIEADEKIFIQTLEKTLESHGLYQLVSYHMLNRGLYNWRYTRSESGLMVMVPRKAEPGDILAILDGGKVPSLLRACPGEDGLRYRVVHTAYIHGYMDGEVAAAVGEGRLEYQELLLV
ncbi:heterokaryon incompatibility protein-domain-containing protein [Poronia punctata]|nr:heterokaryon incompatibility protein-domain-containing protein [Poronia punctata]